MKLIGGKEYYLLFKDLFSHEERIYFLKHKSEVLTITKGTKLGLESRGAVLSVFWAAIEVVSLPARSSLITSKNQVQFII